jgi:uncharacterized protein YndB with AHSA1/START domain
MTADLKEKTNVRSPIEDVVSLDASPATVWRALTDAEELTRWFPQAAAVEPGVGGTISLSWGGGSFEKAIIEIWEPNRRLRTVQQRRDAAGRLVEIAIDFFIESERGRTVLRVVHAGFGAGAEWDEEYDGTVRGWAYELRGLRHYLSRHAGINRQIAMAEAATSLPTDTAYARIVGPDGLGATSLKGLREGDAYRLSGKVGHLEGHVLVNRPPTDFAGTVSNLNDALLRYELYAGSAKLWVATWGVEASSVKELERGLKVIVGSL